MQDTAQCHRQEGAAVSRRDSNGYVHLTAVDVEAIVVDEASTDDTQALR
jgi:hypothetical protein